MITEITIVKTSAVGIGSFDKMPHNKTYSRIIANSPINFLSRLVSFTIMSELLNSHDQKAIVPLFLRQLAL